MSPRTPVGSRHEQNVSLTPPVEFVSLPTYRGSRWLRTVLLNPSTDATTLDRLFGGIEAFLDGERD